MASESFRGRLLRSVEPAGFDPQVARASRVLLVLLLSLAPLASGRADPDRGVLVDAVAARVNARVITLSELIAEARLALLRTRGPRVAATGAMTEALLAAVLRATVHRELLLTEIRRLNLREVPDEEVRRAALALERRFATRAQFERFLEHAGFRGSGPPAEEAHEPELPSLLGSILRAEREVERFLDVRIRLEEPIDPAELRACYDANAERFEGLGFADVRPRIKEALERQREQASFESLLEQLEARADVQYLPPFSRSPPAELEPSPLGFRCPVRR